MSTVTCWSAQSSLSIYRLSETPPRLTFEDVLKPGSEQVCAGYAIYGPSTMLVLSVGQGVQVFTFDGNIGDFRQTQTNITITPDTSEIAINASRRRHWDVRLRAYIDDSFDGATGAKGREYNIRWIASMVAEVHRILMREGVFIYPVDESNRAQGGKLRLLYEANPMSYLIEQADGSATDGNGRLMKVMPTGLHQRTAVMLGSRDEIARLSRYLAGKRS